jgi:hypothetical protein
MTPYQYASRIRSTQAWRKLSKRVIREEGVCWLQLPGCTRIATTADHIVPATVRPDLILVRANCRAACLSCNRRRGTTPVDQLDELRQRTPTQLDQQRKARRHISSKRKTAPAAMFFDANYHPGKNTRRASLLKDIPPQGTVVTCGPNDEIPD